MLVVFSNSTKSSLVVSGCSSSKHHHGFMNNLCTVQNDVIIMSNAVAWQQVKPEQQLLNGIWLQLPQQQPAPDPASCLKGCHPKPVSYSDSMCCGHMGCLEGFATDDYWARQACSYLLDEAAAI